MVLVRFVDDICTKSLPRKGKPIWERMMYCIQRRADLIVCLLFLLRFNAIKNELTSIEEAHHAYYEKCLKMF